MKKSSDATNVEAIFIFWIRAGSRISEKKNSDPKHREEKRGNWNCTVQFPISAFYYVWVRDKQRVEYHLRWKSHRKLLVLEFSSWLSILCNIFKQLLSSLYCSISQIIQQLILKNRKILWKKLTVNAHSWRTALFSKSRDIDALDFSYLWGCPRPAAQSMIYSFNSTFLRHWC